jgi:hypothetical protein
MTDDWKPVGLYNVVDRPEYNCSLEEFRNGPHQMMFIHLTVHQWTKQALKIMKREFALLREHVTCPLYGAGDVDDDKWSSFVKLFGFKFLRNVNCTDGKQRRLFIHIKDDKKNEFKQTDHTVVPIVPVGTVERAAAVPVNSVQRREHSAQSSADGNPSQ